MIEYIEISAIMQSLNTKTMQPLLFNKIRLKLGQVKLVHLLIAAAVATFVLVQFKNKPLEDLTYENGLYVCRRDISLFQRSTMKRHFSVWEHEIWDPAVRGIFQTGNVGGIGMFHAWWLSFVIASVKPSVVIESGAFQGKGTYIIRQNAPSAQIVVVSPKTPEAYRDPASDSLYFTGNEFIDFSLIDWQTTLGKQKIAQALIFFDDHQSAVKRLRQAYEFGFRRFVFDDNYLPYKGDNYSPKQMCDSKKLIIWRYLQSLDPSYAAKGLIDVDDFGKSKKPIDEKEMFEIYRWFQNHVKHYHEGVPLYQITENRFKVPNDDFVKMSEPPLFDVSDPIGARLETTYGTEESMKFTNMVYVELW